MTDQNIENPENTEETTPDEESKTVPYRRFAEMNARFREAEAELKRLRDAEAKRQEEAMRAQNQWRELYEKTQTELEALRSAQTRTEVALAKGLPVELAPRLQGANQEELEADAERLLALLGTKKPAQQQTLRPVPQGGEPQNFDLSRMTAEEIRRHADKLLGK